MNKNGTRIFYLDQVNLQLKEGTRQKPTLGIVGQRRGEEDFFFY
jgi:hypothetical protein